MRDFSGIKKIVIKVGTNTLSGPDGIDVFYIEELASQINDIRKHGFIPLLVSSGAIGMGSRELGIKHKVKKIDMRQALAAIGQPVLMHTYRQAFLRYDIPVAQILLTRDTFDNRKAYVNLKNAVDSLLHMGALPVFNENDCISTDEIGTAFGDNDTLSAYIASKTDADLLILLTDIDGLYTDDPKKDKNARIIRTVIEISDEMLNKAGGAGSTHSTGGMKTKLMAARIAGQAGCRVVIAHGREKNILPRILAGEEIGTLFLPSGRLKNRERWILQAQPHGNIVVDDGAFRAVGKKKSLLPSGVLRVEGSFEAGDVITINGTIKAVSALSSKDIEKVAGRHTSELVAILGKDKPDVVVRADDIVIEK
ncbi:glutamate 5-kinase [Spirochaetia bacterium 38H-sp]|uniref:Glutamate 5-kinase n=1 Tax=Rarispira pelagica TaxID=3141764 RepID=A0ABU9U9W2_9SPIR